MRRIVVHPLLVAAFPALFVCSQNIRQFNAGDMVTPLAVLVGAGALLWVIAGLLTRNLRKGAVLASLFLLLCFSFTAARSFVPQFTWVLPGGWAIGPRKITFAAWLLLFAAGAWWTIRSRSDLVKLTQALNAAALVLLLFPAFNIARYEALYRHRPPSEDDAEADALVNAPVAKDGPYPDIYFIVMDAYGREDTLRDLYGLDTSDFTGWLKSKGFYVADRATANYPFTSLAVPSPLQMDYVEGFIPEELRESSTDVHLMGEIANQTVVTQFLRRHGYRIVALSSSYVLTDMQKSADEYLRPGWFTDEFSNALCDMTPIGALWRSHDRLESHRRRLLFMFDALGTLPSRPGPKFVFAHFMSPHRPFVFGPNGEPVSAPVVNLPGHDIPKGEEIAEYRDYYARQVRFLNKKLRDTIERILAGSSRPPVIILQGDHGPISLLDNLWTPPAQGLQERFRILNAYYLCGEPDPALYPSITPVNSFRVAFNHVFGTRFELRPDRNYFPPTKPYQFRDETDVVGDCLVEPPTPGDAR